MTHNYDRAHWTKEFLLAAFSGILYGFTNTVVGHPLDTIKTKMQAQHKYIEDINLNQVFKDVWKNEGI